MPEESTSGSSKPSEPSNHEWQHHETLLIELFGLIHSEGLWHMLSPEAAKIGAALYKKVTGEDIHAPRVGGMKLTIDQHLQLVANVIPISAMQTEFWKLVVQITWLMNAVEKDPYMAKLITESDSPQEFFRMLETKTEQ